jgi:phospholipase C
MKTTPVLTLATLGLLAGCGGGGSVANLPRVSPDSMPFSRVTQMTASKYISHVVVIIQENRSFENFFAGYPGANAPTFGCAKGTPGAGLRPASPRGATSTSGCPLGDTVVPLHPINFDYADLKHYWHPSITDWNNGAMDGFEQGEPSTKYGPTASYSYVERNLVKPYWDMAKQYVLADEMFPTEFGGSFTAHLTLVAGTDNLNKLDNRAEVNFPTIPPSDCDSPPGTTSQVLNAARHISLHGPFPCFNQFRTMAQALDTAGVSWKIYATRLLDAGTWEPFEAIKYVRYGSDWKHNVIAPQTTVLTDAANGNLATVDWVTPSKPDSDHPGDHSPRGPSWVASVVNAIGQSSYWDSTAIIVVWDDWGGWYDNSPPPQLDFRGLGIRVPCLIISPYAKTNYVDHTQYEFGSILRFIEEVNPTVLPLGPTSEGYTDTRATSLDNAFDFTQAPRKFTPFKVKYPPSVFLHEPPSNELVDTE